MGTLQIHPGMKIKTSKKFWQAAALGTLAGMRTMAAPVIANQILTRHPSGHLSKSNLDFMQSERLSVVLKLFGLAELVSDKLPFTPARTKAAGVIARCVSGSLAGASIYKAKGNNALAGATVGAITALCATYGCYLLRKSIGKNSCIPDALTGGIEDLLVIGGGLALINNY